jgi:hypothetical protein
MPKLLTIFEGDCASTDITNMEQVARAINKPADRIMNYFGSKLGSRVNINEDTNSLDGSHENKILLSHLYNYIEKSRDRRFEWHLHSNSNFSICFIFWI